MLHRHELWFRVEFGISDAVMIDDHQTLDERVFGLRDVAEGDGTFVEDSVSHLRVNNVVDQVGDGLFGVFLQTARSRFHRVGHHDDGLFESGGVRPWISEIVFVHLFFAEFVNSLDVEVFHQRASVVCLNDVANRFG